MRKKQQVVAAIFILILSAGCFLWYMIQNSPKKIVASAIYGLDNRILKMTDDFFPNMGIYDMLLRIETEGGYTLSYDGARYHDYYNEREKVIYTSDPNHQKSEIMYQLQQGDKNFGYSEKVIGGKAYLYFPNIFRAPIVIDTNTMSSFAENSPAAKDLIFHFDNHNLFRPPLTLLQLKRSLKGDVSKEWGALLRDTQVKRLAKQKYEVILKTREVEELLQKTKRFLEENQNPLYRNLFGLDSLYQSNVKELSKEENIILIMETDSKDALTKIYDRNGKCYLSLQDGIEFKIPSLEFRVSIKKMEQQNVAVGSLQGRNFVLTYDYKTPKIVTVLPQGTAVTKFTRFEAGKAFNTVTTFENQLSPWQHLRFNFYARPKDVQTRGNYVEILKLSQEDWNHMKNSAINLQGFPGHIFKEEK